MSTILPSCCREGGANLTDDDDEADDEDTVEDEETIADDESSSTCSKLPMRNDRISTKLLSFIFGDGNDDADADSGNVDDEEL